MGVKEEDVNHSQDQAAELVHRYYRAMTTRFNDKVKKLLWFCYSDGMVSPFGLVDGAGNRKPAYYAYLRAAASRSASRAGAGRCAAGPGLASRPVPLNPPA